MKILTKNLEGAALNWAVAKCKNIKVSTRFCKKENEPYKYVWFQTQEYSYSTNDLVWEIYSPSRDWSQGGPIIEREGICISPSAAGLAHWVADMPLRPTSFADRTRCSGTPLIAAMRCYVASKLGDVVEIPEELLR